jgi:hypothetical protein
MTKIRQCCKGCTWLEVLKLMLVTAILEAFNAKWIVTPTQHMLQDRGNPWETLIHDFKVHLNYVRLYLYFIYRFISHIIYNLFALLEY